MIFFLFFFIFFAPTCLFYPELSMKTEIAGAFWFELFELYFTAFFSNQPVTTLNDRVGCSKNLGQHAKHVKMAPDDNKDV